MGKSHQKQKNPVAASSDSDAIARAEANLKPTGKAAVSGHQDPETVPTGEAGGQPFTSPAPSTDPPTTDSLVFGKILVTLSDRLFVRWAGEAAAMSEEMRLAAVDAWARTFDTYLPTLMSAGPLGQLCLLYSTHAALCFYKTKTGAPAPAESWTTAPLPESSVSEEAEKPPS